MTTHATRSSAGSWVAVLLALGVAACGAEAPGSGEGAVGDGPPMPAPAGPEAEVEPVVAAQLDSGTVAYRDGRLEDARRHYRRATELNPHVASAWFGVHMAEGALGNVEAADSALERVRTLAPAVVPPGGHGETEGAESDYDHEAVSSD